jgi:hypothetical protein
MEADRLWEMRSIRRLALLGALSTVDADRFVYRLDPRSQ